MNRRGFLQGIGYAGAALITALPGVVLAVPDEIPDFHAGHVFPHKEALSGIDVWIPNMFPDHWLSGEQLKFLFDLHLNKSDIVRVTFADIGTPVFRWWHGTGDATRTYRPDLLLLNFDPDRVYQHTRLLNLAIDHTRARNSVLAVLRASGRGMHSAMQSSLTNRRLLKAGVPVLAARDEYGLVNVMRDAAGATHDQSFDWGDFQRMLSTGSLIVSAAGECGYPVREADLIVGCIRQLEDSGFPLHRYETVMVTVYGANDYETFCGLVEAFNAVWGDGARAVKIFKWNQLVTDGPRLALHLLATAPSFSQGAGVKHASHR